MNSKPNGTRDFRVMARLVDSKVWTELTNEQITNKSVAAIELLVIPSGFSVNKDLMGHVATSEPSQHVEVRSAEGLLPYSKGLLPSNLISYIIRRNSVDQIKKGESRVAKLTTGPLYFESPESIKWALQYLDTAHFSQFLGFVNTAIQNSGIVALVSSKLLSTSDFDRRDVNGKTSFPRFSPSSKAHSLTIVTRTIQGRGELLERNVASVKKLKFCLIASGVNVEHLIVAPHDLAISIDGVSVAHTEKSELSDTRFLAVQKALSFVDSEYVWFVDDDDYVLEEFGAVLAAYFNFQHELQPIFTNSIQLIESNYGRRSRFGHKYVASAGALSLDALNQTPFCSVIFPTREIAKFASADFSSIRLLEDHFLITSILANPRIEPHYLDSLSTAISVRQSGQTIQTLTDTAWPQAYLTNYNFLINHLSPQSDIPMMVVHLRKGQVASTRIIARVLRAIISPTAWRIALQLRLIERFLKGQLSIADVKSLITRANF